METLPPGRHPLSPEYVAAHQRGRLIAALPVCLSENGYERTTVAAISRRATISKRDFYKRFSSKEDCFLAAFDEAIAAVHALIDEACADRDEPAERVQAALAALLAAISEQPDLARLVLVESLHAGPVVYGHYQEAVEAFAARLRVAGAPAPRVQLTDEAVVGGIATLLGRRLLAGDLDVEPLLAGLTEFALTPYLGPASARRVALWPKDAP